MSGNAPNHQEGAHLPLQNRLDIDIRARQFMVEKIYEDFMQRNPQPINDMQKKNILDNVMRLEEGLYRVSTSKEEYMNLDTLDTRMQNLINPPSVNNQNQQYSTRDNNTPLLDIGLPASQTMLINEVVMQQNPQPINDMQKKMFLDNVRHLEEGLYRISISKEEYMNLDTLVNNQNQQDVTLDSDTPLLDIMPPSVNNQNQQNATLVNNTPLLDIDLTARQTMLDKLREFSIQRYSQPMNDMQKRNFKKILSFLEAWLYKLSTSKEEYMNMDTLETRLQNLIKRFPVKNQNQQDVTRVNNNPGMQQSGATSVVPRRGIDIPTRQVMLQKIHEIVIQRYLQHMNDTQKKKLTDTVRRLEEGLYRLSTSKEEYMNLDTLDNRLQNLNKQPSLDNQNGRKYRDH